MGLDVYLYRKNEGFEDGKRRMAEYEAFSEARWNTVVGENVAYGDADSEKVKTWAADVDAKKVELGLDKWGDDEVGKTQIEEPSAKYPDHLCKIGYLRSSYNDAGLNRILRDRVGRDLYSVFEAGDQYEFTPDWEDSVERARALLSDYRKYRTEFGYFTVIDYSNFGKPQPIGSAADVLDLFHKEAKKGGAGWWSNNRLFMIQSDPPKLRALVHGIDMLGHPTIYAVVEPAQGEDGQGDDWYEQALEITVEMCEWVLATGEPERYFLHWSG